jgi:vancomycin permeability regulator SanA
MKRMAAWILYLGDLFFLECYSFFLLTRFYDTERQLANLALAILPIGLAWAAIGWHFKAFDPHLPYRKLLLRAFLAWPLAFAIHEGIYSLAFNAVMRGVVAARFRVSFGMLYLLMGGFLLLAAWRSGYFLYHCALGDPRPWPRFLARGSLAAVVTLAVVLCIPRAALGAQYASHIYTIDAVPDRSVALVFGAGLFVNNTPSFILKDRVITAARLYQMGKVQRLILSGDARDPTGDEVQAMRKLALENGVPESALVLDNEGYRTYDSCARAVQVFGASQGIVVSQSYYLDRTLYLCNHLGFESVGVTSDLSPHSLPSLAIWNLREIPASFLAWVQITAAPPAVPTSMGQE